MKRTLWGNIVNGAWNHSVRLQDHAGRVQGWRSVCWGVLAIPPLENKKGFLDVGFCFLVSGFWFIGWSVSKNMFPRKYLLHNTEFPFHVFDNYCSHIDGFRYFILRIFIICRCTSFRHLSTYGIFPNLKSIKTNVSEMFPFSNIVRSILVCWIHWKDH